MNYKHTHTCTHIQRKHMQDIRTPGVMTPPQLTAVNLSLLCHRFLFETAGGLSIQHRKIKRIYGHWKEVLSYKRQEVPVSGTIAATATLWSFIWFEKPNKIGLLLSFNVHSFCSVFLLFGVTENKPSSKVLTQHRYYHRS